MSTISFHQFWPEARTRLVLSIPRCDHQVGLLSHLYSSVHGSTSSWHCVRTSCAGSCHGASGLHTGEVVCKGSFLCLSSRGREAGGAVNGGRSSACARASATSSLRINKQRAVRRSQAPVYLFLLHEQRTSQAATPATFLPIVFLIKDCVETIWSLLIKLWVVCSSSMTFWSQNSVGLSEANFFVSWQVSRPQELAECIDPSPCTQHWGEQLQYINLNIENWHACLGFRHKAGKTVTACTFKDTKCGKPGVLRLFSCQIWPNVLFLHSDTNPLLSYLEHKPRWWPCLRCREKFLGCFKSKMVSVLFSAFSFLLTDQWRQTRPKKDPLPQTSRWCESKSWGKLWIHENNDWAKRNLEKGTRFWSLL